jgi:DnaJ-domain-containing protein 1
MEPPTGGIAGITGGPGTRRPGGRDAPPSLADKLGLTRISDESLAIELERRRRLRGKLANRRPAADEELDAMNAARKQRMKNMQVSKAYAHLELSPGASRSQLERAYRLQLRQYHPDKHIGDPERHQSAVALAVTLTDAYLLLLQR